MNFIRLGLVMLGAVLASLPAVAAPRERVQLDDRWRFQIESKIVAPSGDNTFAITDWLIKESPGGEADATMMTDSPSEISNGWTPARTGEDLTAQHKNKFVWYRVTLDPLLAAHPIKGARLIFFAAAGPHIVVFLNGHKLVEHTANVRNLNASEVLQTGAFAQENQSQVNEVDGVPQCFEACLEPYWNEQGANELAVMVRANAEESNGIIGPVILFGGFPPESQPGFEDSSWRSVHLPHDYVVEGAFNSKYNNQRGALPVPRAWYRRNLEIARGYQGKSLWLDFDGIYRDSRVWLNGHYLGNHSSGYTSFRYDISSLVNFGGTNVLVVQVDPRVGEGWWYEGGGIYRHVWLNIADRLHVAPCGTFVTAEVKGVTTKNPSAELTIKTRITNSASADENFELFSTVIDPGGKLIAEIKQTVAAKAGAEIEITQNVSATSAQLWSCETPNLYRVETKIMRGQEVVDIYETPFGIRTIRFDVDQGFFLNEKPVKIYGTCNHLDFAGVGIAMPDNLQEWRIRKTQEMGANAWRCAHNPPSPEFLDACDRLGMLVMDETRHLADTTDRKTGTGEGYVPGDMSELESMLVRDRNHPSIFLWGLCNEEKNTSANKKLLEALQAQTKHFDTTRPTTAANIFGKGIGMETVTDVDGLNYTHMNYDGVRKNLPGKPLLGTEIGSARADRGIYYDAPTSAYPKKNPPVYIRNYSTWFTKGDPEANENISQWFPIAQRQWVAGGFYWTGYDYKGEPSPSEWPAISSHFGIFDTCGFPKDNYFYYKAWWTTNPVIHVFPHWNWSKEGQPMRVVVFSNAKKIELLLNGKSFGTQEMPPNQSVEWQVPYTPGRLEARGTLATGKIIADVVETTGEPTTLLLRTDLQKLRANDEDVSVAEISVVDGQGRVIPTANNLVHFTLSGSGTIAGVGNGDPASHEPDLATQRRAFNGHCAALLRAGNKSGKLVLTATSPGLKSASLEIVIDRP